MPIIIKKKTRVNNITLHLKKVEKEKHIQLKVSREKEIKIRAETNEIEIRKTI